MKKATLFRISYDFVGKKNSPKDKLDAPLSKRNYSCFVDYFEKDWSSVKEQEEEPITLTGGTMFLRL
jgi:hypothetical protein